MGGSEQRPRINDVEKVLQSADESRLIVTGLTEAEDRDGGGRGNGAGTGHDRWRIEGGGLRIYAKVQCVKFT